MSLDKTQKRLQKVRDKNRQLRRDGLVPLSEPGPWFSIPLPYRFNPGFFPGLLSADPPDDKVFIPNLPAAS